MLSFLLLYTRPPQTICCHFFLFTRPPSRSLPRRLSSRDLHQRRKPRPKISRGLSLASLRSLTGEDDLWRSAAKETLPPVYSPPLVCRLPFQCWPPQNHHREGPPQNHHREHPPPSLPHDLTFGRPAARCTTGPQGKRLPGM